MFSIRTKNLYSQNVNNWRRIRVKGTQRDNCIVHVWTTPVDSSAWRSTRTYASAVGSSVDVALGDREQSPAATVVIGDHRLIGTGRFFVHVRDEGSGYRFHLRRKVAFQRSPPATNERATRLERRKFQHKKRRLAGGRYGGGAKISVRHASEGTRIKRYLLVVAPMSVGRGGPGKASGSVWRKARGNAGILTSAVWSSASCENNIFLLFLLLFNHGFEELWEVFLSYLFTNYFWTNRFEYFSSF